MYTPTVMMMRVRADAPRAGCRVKRWMAMASPAVMATAARAAVARATAPAPPRARKNETVNMGPSITKAPWAKLMTPVTR
jgi:hypothetical protein